MYRIPTFLLSFLFISLCSFPLYASAAVVDLPVGGVVTSTPLPCANIPGAFQMFVLEKLFGMLPFTFSFIWAPPPLTVTCLYNGTCINTPGIGPISSGPALPPYIGQMLLGLAFPTPTACVVAGVPVPGFLIKLVGTSLF